MLMLPVVLMVLTIGIARWAQQPPSTAGIGAGQGVTFEAGARRALKGLPRVADDVRPLRSGLSIPEAATGPLPQAPVAGTDLPNVATMEASAGDLATRTLEPHDGGGADVAAVGVDPMQAAGLAPVSPGRPVAAVQSLPAASSSNAGGVEPVPVLAGRGDPIAEAAAAPRPLAGTGPDTTVALLTPPEAIFGRDGEETQCRFTPGAVSRTSVPAGPPPSDPDQFGVVLAQAARAQLDDFIIYNDRYTRLKYPMGDVHPMYGVCTDVIIRAYRDLGIDLQEMVQTTKSGSGDANIDHRRVDTLRRFFSRFGEVLPISTFAEDYRPGDIVTYWRPQNRHSRTHIAIVSDLTAESGRPLIIHNRGWGPQQEDGLFVDQITGHFRFSGLKGAPVVTAPTPGPVSGPSSGKAATAKRVSGAPAAPRSQVIRTGGLPRAEDGAGRLVPRSQPER